jgi:hypothetical protein
MKGGAVRDKKEWEECGTHEGLTGEVAAGAGAAVGDGLGEGVHRGGGRRSREPSASIISS